MKNKISSINSSSNLLSLSKIIFKNAKDLYKEARLLLFFRKNARALFLSQIGGEELGKYLLCTSAYTQYRSDNFNISAFNKMFYTHKEKTILVNFIEDILLNIDPKNRIERISETDDLEKMKLFSLYADVYENQYLISPNDLVQRSMARNAVKWLGNRIKLFSKINFLEIAEKMERISDDGFKQLWEKFNNEIKEMCIKVKYGT